jgi:hypothetical protein
MKEITALMYRYQKEGRMLVSDVEMSEIISDAGFSVNAKYVERLRRHLEIAPLIKYRKFFDDELSHIHKIIKEHVYGESPDDWQLAVSDAVMAAILTERGYKVNVKFVERTRRSLGIEPLGKRGGAREGAGRPSMASNISDHAYALVMVNHFSDTYRLSIRHNSSGELMGSSGIDVHDRFGYHTTDLEDAMQRKEKRLAKCAKVRQPAEMGVNIQVETDAGDIGQIVTEQINRHINSYGKSGSGGGILNTRAAQAYCSI